MPTWPPVTHLDVQDRVGSVTRAPGLLAARGLASDYPGGTYVSTDLNGGTAHQSDGASWVQSGAGTAVTPGIRLAAASLPKAADPQDRWHALANALERCGTEGFFTRVGCEESARRQYCDGAWGSVAQCPVSRRSENAE